MRSDLYTYYERELRFIRDLAAEFSAQYPKVAGRLMLERDQCADPHVERLIESCALLASRVHLKLDDEFPQITESLLQVLYPHYLAPIPSMSIVQFVLDAERGKLTSGYTIDRHRALIAKPAPDAVCRFRTVYPTTLWPLFIPADGVRTVRGATDSAGRTAPGAIVLELRTHGEVRLPELQIESLRLHITGGPLLAPQLYEMLLGHCYRMELTDPEAGPGRAPLVLPPGSLRDVGFRADEGMLPYSHRSFVGYRLLQEYFHFPAKFFFVDVANLGVLRSTRFATRAVLTMFLDQPPLEQRLTPDNLRLGCTPIVNLFQQVAEAIPLDHAHSEYPIVPDQRRQRSTEVYSVDRVASLTPSTGASVEFEPFYSLRHGSERRDQRAFWHATRRPSERKDDPGTEVYLSLVDLDFRPTLPASGYLTATVTCTNRDLPAQLRIGTAAEPADRRDRDRRGDFEIDGGGPIKSIIALTKPTRTVRAPARPGLQWRLISQLSLNYLSVVGADEHASPETLKEVLGLYDFSEEPSVQQQIGGITRVESRPVTRRIRTEAGSGFARGVRTTLDFDEERFHGSSIYLFSAVLEKFLGLYVSVNSFSELVARTSGAKVLKHWQPRSGEQVLL